MDKKNEPHKCLGCGKPGHYEATETYGLCNNCSDQDPSGIRVGDLD